MERRGSDGSGESMALARARAALDHAKQVMDAGAAKGPVPAAAAPLQTSVPPARSRPAWSRLMPALVAVTIFLLFALLGYRSRAARMAESVSELTAAVTAVQEQQKREAQLHAQRVEELTRQLDALARPAPTLPRRKFLGLF